MLRRVPRGFDPSEIRLIGEAKGEPPFKGTLRHHGWRDCLVAPVPSVGGTRRALCVYDPQGLLTSRSVA